MSNIAIKTVKVAELRSTYDRLFRQANVHYHSCVGASEVRNWQTVAKRVLEEALSLKCNRASEYDNDQMAQAIAALTERLEGSGARIEREDQRVSDLKDKAQQKREATVPVLRLIMGGLSQIH
jgi:hypothetical protein